MLVLVKPVKGNVTLPSGVVISKQVEVEKTKEISRAIRFGDLEVVVAKTTKSTKGDK